MKLRWRLVFALAIASLLPIVPLILSMNSVVNLGVSTLAPKEIGSGLREGILLVRQYLNDTKNSQENKLNIISKLNDNNLLRIKLDSLETLHYYDGKDWYKISYGKKLLSFPSAPTTNSFEKIPESIIVEKQSYGKKWRLEKHLSQEVIESANLLQQASAGWTLRSSERDRVVSSLIGTYLVTYSIAIIFSIIAGLIVIIPATKRIENLSKVAESVRSGDESARSTDVKGGEIGHLANTFNLMVDRLSESRKKAAEMEKMAGWRELARVLAHEIKNPLTPIQLSVQQISDSYTGDDDKFARNLAVTREIVDEEVESLRKLVKEFGEFARAPKLELELSSPFKMIKDISSLYGSSIGNDIIEDNKNTLIDSEKLKRAIINLLDNALAAAGKNGSILLSYSMNESSFSIVVDDSGPGIDEEKREKIFEPYFTTKKTGVGLGLPIVKTTCEQHGGTISIEKSSLLGGARFLIEIPLKNE